MTKVNDTQLVPYSLEAATVEALKSKYLDITIQPDDKAAYAMCMAGLRECREIRLAVDAWHKSRKEWIVKAGKHYDSERRRVHALVAPIEEHLATVRKIEDDRKEAIKAEAEKKERERVEGIRAKLQDIKAHMNIYGISSGPIQEKILSLKTIQLTEDVFNEFLEEAIKTFNETMESLSEALTSALKWEADQGAAKVEAERLEKIRKEQEALAKQIEELSKIEEEKARKVREALDDERRKIEAERKALEDAKKTEKERQERAEFERKAQEEAKVRAEQAAKEKVERQAKEKAEREENDRIERVKREMLAPDKDKLLKWVASFNDTNIQRPSLKSPEAREILRIAEEQIEMILQDAQRKTEAL